MNKNYKVYKHQNIITGKSYVGITKLDVKTRWSNGIGYINNKKFYSDIKKYGWESFSHEILSDGLSYKEAVIEEAYLIKKLDLVNNGYNNNYSGYGGNYAKFDFFDFEPIDNTEFVEYKNTVNYFTRVPNIFIRANLKKQFGLNRIFLFTYINIDRNRSYENKSYICIGEILKQCGYKLAKNKPKVFFEIIKSILFLIESNYIEADIDIYDVDYYTCIPIKIIDKNFDCCENFTKIYGKDYDSIINSDTTLSKESLLMAFLYINSYIGCRPKNMDGSEIMYNPETKPEAFWRSIEYMAKELSMSKDTITQCIDYLTTSTDKREALFVKKEVGSVQINNKPQNVPNIYVLKKEGYDQEIEWALSKMYEVYGVDEFDVIKGGIKNK